MEITPDISHMIMNSFLIDMADTYRIADHGIEAIYNLYKEKGLEYFNAFLSFIASILERHQPCELVKTKAVSKIYKNQDKYIIYTDTVEKWMKAFSI